MQDSIRISPFTTPAPELRPLSPTLTAKDIFERPSTSRIRSKAAVNSHTSPLAIPRHAIATANPARSSTTAPSETACKKGQKLPQNTPVFTALYLLFFIGGKNSPVFPEFLPSQPPQKTFATARQASLSCSAKIALSSPNISRPRNGKYSLGAQPKISNFSRRFSLNIYKREKFAQNRPQNADFFPSSRREKLAINPSYPFRKNRRFFALWLRSANRRFRHTSTRKTPTALPSSHCLDLSPHLRHDPKLLGIGCNSTSTAVTYYSAPIACLFVRRESQ